MSELGPEDESLAVGWLQHTLKSAPETFATWDALNTLSQRDLDRTWPIVLSLIAKAPEEALPSIGTGLLENLIRAFPAVAGPMAATAARDERFRVALSWAYLSRVATPPEVREQLVLATWGKIRILD